MLWVTQLSTAAMSVAIARSINRDNLYSSDNVILISLLTYSISVELTPLLKNIKVFRCPTFGTSTPNTLYMSDMYSTTVSVMSLGARDQNTIQVLVHRARRTNRHSAGTLSVCIRYTP